MQHTDGDDEVVEQDPEGRYYRYKEAVGKGRFKNVFKAFDTQIGIDVAWSKINANSGAIHLSGDQLAEVARDIQKGFDLDHPNIIKCFKCWENYEQHCINLITELFTSGNLRQYRNLHKQLDLKAVKRMARQILKGLQYLHSMSPPITHGDLRCDKIYVNGHNGEIKIGDLGLTTLLPYRWDEQQGPGEEAATSGRNSLDRPEGANTFTPSHHHPTFDTQSDIYAFGLCMLELLTLKQVDPQHCTNADQLLGEVQDQECREFVSRCIGPVEQRATADELLEHMFLSNRKMNPSTLEGDVSGSSSSKALHDLEKRRAEDSQDPGAPIAVGKLRGEDYNFEFSGKLKDGRMLCRLVMTAAAAPETYSDERPALRTIDFDFNPEDESADTLAAEISENFNLSPTDTEICAAALREWLAREMPGSESQK